MQEEFVRRQAIGCLEKLLIFLRDKVGQDKKICLPLLWRNFMHRYSSYLQEKETELVASSYKDTQV